MTLYTVSFVVVQSLSHVWLFAIPWTAAQILCPSLSPRVCSNSCPLSECCHPNIPSSVAPSPLICYPDSFPASGLLQRVSSSHQVTKALEFRFSSVLLVNTLDWSSLGFIGLISLQSKGLSRVFSRTIIRKHKFFGAQHSLRSNSHICTWLLEKP